MCMYRQFCVYSLWWIYFQWFDCIVCLSNIFAVNIVFFLFKSILTKCVPLVDADPFLHSLLYGTQSMISFHAVCLCFVSSQCVSVIKCTENNLFCVKKLCLCWSNQTTSYSVQTARWSVHMLVYAVYAVVYWRSVCLFVQQRSELDKSIADTEQALSRCSTSLRAYESVGSDFDAVVQEFTELRSVIENKRWALHELKKHPVNASASDANRTLFSWR